MKLTARQFALINRIIQMDNNWQQKVYFLGELSIAFDIFKIIYSNVEWENFIEWDIEFSSEQKVFIKKIIDELQWSVLDAENVLKLKELLY